SYAASFSATQLIDVRHSLPFPTRRSSDLGHRVGARDELVVEPVGLERRGDLERVDRLDADGVQAPAEEVERILRASLRTAVGLGARGRLDPCGRRLCPADEGLAHVGLHAALGAILASWGPGRGVLTDEPSWR